jgi:hypothetical protein
MESFVRGADRCVAHLTGGTRCVLPGVQPDPERGGSVCRFHMPAHDAPPWAAPPPAERFVIKFRGRALAPTIWDGDLLMVDPCGRPGAGDYVFVAVQGRRVVRRLDRAASGWRLGGAASPPLTIASGAVLLGQVVGICRPAPAPIDGSGAAGP